MGYTLHQFAESCLGTLTLPIFFLAPGYLIATLSNLLGFRHMRSAERLLWSLTLSTPIAILLAVHPGTHISPRDIRYTFILIATLAALQLARDIRAPIKRLQTTTRWCLLAATLLTAFCILAPLGITVGHRLFENTAWQDWNIRIQLVNAAIRGGASPMNPMYAVEGQLAPMHYYFYWYVLCAQIAQLTGIGARAALTASCAAAGLTLMAVLLLAVKHLRISDQPLRRLAVATLAAASVIGFDILTVLIDLRHGHLRPDPQHAIIDHAPGLINMCLWSPHHVAGAASCLTGLLLVITTRSSTTTGSSTTGSSTTGKAHWPRCLLHAALAGICFAAAAGTSTFLTAVFAVVCTAVFLDAAWRRETTVAATLAAAGALALLLTLPFLHQIAATAQTPTAATNTASSNFPIHLTLRYSDQAHGILNRLLYDRRHLPTPAKSTLPLLLLRIPVILALLLIDFGFAIPVVLHRIRRDWLTPAPMARSQRLLWMVFLAAAIPGFLLSTSSPFHPENDLAFHTGVVLRMVTALWAAPLLLDYLARRKLHQPIPLWIATAFILGLCSLAAQLFIGRFAIPLVNAGIVKPYVVAERVPHTAARFYDLELAMDAAAQHAPANGIVQGYPHSRMAPILLLYTHRQMAASDDGCNVPFGGSIDRCKTASTALNQLFGGTPRFQGASPLLPHLPPNPALMTAANFAQQCTQQHLSVIVADYTSPAWQTPGTWVWTLTPIFANPTARVFTCPAA